MALLAASSAMGDSPRAATGLAATLLALDHPAAAAVALSRAGGDDPWTRWWGVLAAGQAAGGPDRDEALAAALGAPAEGPDGREVARRLEDLADELAALEGADDRGARFAILGHRARPRRQVLLAGRSSAAFIIEPGWESVRLVRLGPSEGPALGNRAHSSLTEVIGGDPRGDAGPDGTCRTTGPPTSTPRPCSAPCARIPPPATAAWWRWRARSPRSASG